VRSSGHIRAAVVCMVVAVLAAACSGDDSAPDEADPADSRTTSPPETSSPAHSTSSTTTPPPVRAPAVDPAVLEGPITVGEMAGPADPRPVDLAAIGYTQEEYFASGTATAFGAAGGLTEDGKWDATPSTAAPYKTRFIVRRPSDPARFNGTVVVEWLNVTVVEAAPEWAYTSRAIIDAGAAWVGLSAQSFAIVGGTSAIQTGEAAQAAQANGGIRAANPERYGSLDHPGDEYAFDILSQVGAAFRSPGRVQPLGPREARRVIAAGESQSAAFMTSYINAIQPIANVFDGFFVHSRGSGAAGLEGALAMSSPGAGYKLRTDLDARIMVFQTETDVGPLLSYAKARQPDTDGLRVWEVPGTAHADAYLVGGEFALCPAGINNGPQHYVSNAAMYALVRWVEDGTPPANADRIATDGVDSTSIERDTHGIALGGIRTPSVDVPVSTLTGAAPPNTPVLCALFGGATPFDQAKLTSLYPDQQAYLDAFDEALDAAIDLGFVREADRAEFASEARAVTF
jgi:hypothetical protein